MKRDELDVVLRQMIRENLESSSLELWTRLTRIVTNSGNNPKILNFKYNNSEIKQALTDLLKRMENSGI